uniref:NADH-ubiquinone oxidoreductase chain 1 n=1 Tax=Bothropolys sp. SP-2004 TaxID=292347 RepID=A5D6K2_9MYRI|nr:NADH dehydrogenase subunit 1 [Bothropolys sp. SP-2004]
MEYLISIIDYVILVVCVLISVAFLTLFERKGLGYIQIRKGPNKVGFMGILQPFADAIKLFTKEGIHPIMSNFISYYLCPVFALFLSLGVWLVVPSYFLILDFSLGVVYVLAFISVSVYTVVGAGWFSNSKYALLGALRSVAQTISYEVCLAMVLILVMILVFSYDLSLLGLWQSNLWFIFIFLPVSFMWMLIMLAETNRTPFDFAEGESELVSGFNIEYGSGGFALIFMAEYASILFMSGIFVLLFLGGVSLAFGIKIGIISFLFIWVRGLLPRYRYDKLMYLAWKSLLPLVFNYFIFIFGMMILL